MEQSQMNVQKLLGTAKALVADDKGLLAMDESIPTCNKRFAKLGIPQTEEARRAYREMIVTTPGLGDCIGGAILYDETIRQKTRNGTPFIKVLTDAGIIPGIKVDAGAKDMAGHPGEKLTEGRPDCPLGSKSMFRWALVSPSGGRCWPWAMAFPAAVASKRTRRRWLNTPWRARTLDWCRSSSRKF
jgi:hypothetical protein